MNTLDSTCLDFDGRIIAGLQIATLCECVYTDFADLVRLLFQRFIKGLSVHLVCEVTKSLTLSLLSFFLPKNVSFSITRTENRNTFYVQA